MRGVTSCIGVSKEVVSSIPGIFVKKFRVLLIPHFHGRVFGPLRFLKGLCSLCGQPL